MTAYDYDFFVVGAGSGGVRAARIAAGHGARVAIAEDDRFGGTCVIRGCVPKKLFVYASRFADAFDDARGFGWRSERPDFSWADLVAAKDREISRLEGLYRGTLARAGVANFEERAVVAGPHAVKLSKSGKVVTAARILIATGGKPWREVEHGGANLAISSNEAFDLKRLPKRMVIVGGGYIAVEFAGIFHGVGADVTLVHRGDKVLRGFDEDLRDDLMTSLRQRGIKLVMDDVLTGIDRADGGLAVTLRSGSELFADEVMLAIGRVPNTVGLGLEEAGVMLKANGAIVVDDENTSSVPSIFAVGDVTDRVNLTPVAIREGHALADRLFGHKSTRVHYEAIPTAVFSTPEIGTVGLSEFEARAKFGAVDIYKTRFRSMKATISGRDQRVLMKLVVEARSGKVIGVHVLGDDAAEIVQMAAIAVRMGATKADFDATMALHPSAGEELVTLREPWQPPAT
ncbi:MAG: glutathione-disulfide reductase [Hyphomicrobium sp.]